MVLDPEPETTPEPFQRPEPAGADDVSKPCEDDGRRDAAPGNAPAPGDRGAPGTPEAPAAAFLEGGPGGPSGLAHRPRAPPSGSAADPRARPHRRLSRTQEMVPAASGNAQDSAEALKPGEGPRAEPQLRLHFAAQSPERVGRGDRRSADARAGAIPGSSGAREKLGGTALSAARALRKSCRIGGSVALDAEEMRRIRIARFGGGNEPSAGPCAGVCREDCIAGGVDCTSPLRPQTVA